MIGNCSFIKWNGNTTFSYDDFELISADKLKALDTVKPSASQETVGDSWATEHMQPLSVYLVKIKYHQKRLWKCDQDKELSLTAANVHQRYLDGDIIICTQFQNYNEHYLNKNVAIWSMCFTNYRQNTVHAKHQRKQPPQINLDTWHKCCLEVKYSQCRCAKLHHAYYTHQLHHLSIRLPI